MAVTLFMRIPELTPERYDRMMLELGLDPNPPAGMILHVASEAVGAINVHEVWQTPQAAESFVAGRLAAALGSVGVTEQLSYRIEPLRNLFAAEMDAVERIGATSLPPGVRGTLAS
jgi:hypothetical protein